MYDIDNDESITYDEMLQVVGSVYKMASPMVQLPQDEDTPKKVRSDQVCTAGTCTDRKDLGGARECSEWTRSSRKWTRTMTES